MQQGFAEEVRAQQKTLVQEFSLREQQEEIRWKQKSRIRWLKEGERNTRFFHKDVIQHQQGKRMLQLKQEDKTHVETQEELELTLNDFFTDLLEELDYNQNESQMKVLQNIPRVITNERNFMIMKPIKMEEVKEVVKQMANDKYLGPNGFTMNFFQSYW